MSQFHKILFKYWGHSQFRPLQEDIIKSVAQGHDTLGLLPTGGGKSVTFQVPVLAQEGICVVVSPLIALMKDQVQNLRDMQIKAVALYSGMSGHEIEITLNKCIYGGVKFLYVSPERLGTDLFLQKVRQMPVSLIAVDEAHCISQWGYDFRPSYLKIVSLRQILPEVPVLALTATATPEVVQDIQTKLNFNSPKVFRKSFERKNLVYLVRHVDDKLRYLVKIMRGVKGSGVVYVRSRRRAREVAEFLNQHRITAQYYHAGLTNAVKDYRQKAWKNNQVRVMVATNAFGMGIDKADVRVVVHVDLPDTLEAYFQEAGRAGRDQMKAYAVLLYRNADKVQLLKRIKTSYPEPSVIKRVYVSLGNFYQLAEGCGAGRVFDFNIATFCHNFKFNVLQAYNSLKILQRAGYVELTDDLEHAARIHFVVSRDDLYRFEDSREALDSIIKLLLRSYTGLFTDYVAIDEELMARKGNVTVQKIKESLIELERLKYIRYIPRKKTPFIVFTQERLPKSYISLTKDVYVKRKENFSQRIHSVLHYASSQDRCRSQMLLEYFGEKNTTPCGQCDVCLEKGKQDSKVSEDIVMELKGRLSNSALTVDDLVGRSRFDEESVLDMVQQLLDERRIEYSKDNKLLWTSDNKNNN